MAQNVLEFLIKQSGGDKAGEAVKDLSKGMSDLEKAVAGTRSTIGGLDQDMTLFGRNVGSTSDFLNGLGISIPISPMQLFGQATKIASDQVVEAFEKTIALADSVRTLSGNIGTSTEEASRLIQVFDDYGISADKVGSSMAMATKNGFEPSVDALADLADELQGIQDPNERAAKLAEIFGRSWMDIAPALEKGGDAIRETSDAISDSLVMTQSEIDQIREFQLAVDDLNDAWLAFQASSVGKVIPFATAALKQFNEESEKSTFGEKLMRWIPLLQGFSFYSGVFQKLADGEADMDAAMIQATTDARAMGMQLQWVGKGINGEVIPAVINVGRALGNEKEILEGIPPAVSEYIIAHERAVMGAADLTAATMASAESMQALSTYISGDLGQSIDDFNDQQVEIKDKMGDVLDQIAILKQQGYGEHSQKVQELRGAYQELQTELDLTAAAFEEETARIVYSMAEQQAAVGGTTEAEKDMLMDLALTMGLVDEPTMALYDALKMLPEATPENEDELARAIDYLGQAARDGTIATWELKRALDMINGTTYDVYLDFHQTGGLDLGMGGGGTRTGTSGEGGDTPEARAEGGSVFPGVPYKVGEDGEETFVPTSAGTIIPNGAGGTTITFAAGSIVIQGNGDPALVEQAANTGVRAALRAQGR